MARQPSPEEFQQLVDEAEQLLEQATDDRAKAIFHISQSFVPFWLGNLGRPATPETLARAEEHARRGLEIAERLDDAELMSAALDGLGGTSSGIGDHAATVEIARRRLALEPRLSLQERLDAYNVFAWQSTLVGEFDEAAAAASRGLSAVQPGQDPHFALSVANWLPYAIALRGRWDEVPAATERCRQLWIEGGRVTAGYALTGFIAGLEVFRARRDEAGIEACSEVVDEIVGQFEEGHPTRRLAGFLGPDTEALADRVAAGWEFYVERLQHVERAFAICADRDQAIAPPAVDQVDRDGSPPGHTPTPRSGAARPRSAAGERRRPARGARPVRGDRVPCRTSPGPRWSSAGSSTMPPSSNGAWASLQDLGDIGQLGRIRDLVG